MSELTHCVGETRANPLKLVEDDDEEQAIDTAAVNSLIVRDYAVHCLVTMPVRQPTDQPHNPTALWRTASQLVYMASVRRVSNQLCVRLLPYRLLVVVGADG